VEIVGEGRTLPEAFSGIALALFAAAVDSTSLAETEVREVRAHGASIPALLHRWLEECLYVHEVEGFACRAIAFVLFDEAPGTGGEPLRLHALLRGETVDVGRHRLLGVIRGISSARDAGAEATPGRFRVLAEIDL
jgi:SHS2 domain-containing protein